VHPGALARRVKEWVGREWAAGSRRLGAGAAVAALLLVALALNAIYVRGQGLGLDEHVPNRLRFHAIPVAMSVLYHGRPHDYTASQFIAFRFQDTAPIDADIEWARGAALPADDGTYYWAADDRGSADYVIAAFALFGPHVSSLYQFFFVVLLASCVLFLIAYRRQPATIGLLFFGLAAIYASLPIVPLSYLMNPVFERPSLFEPRTLNVLAFVATLHLALAAYSRERPRGWWLATVGQVGIFIFCYHARSSLGAEAAFIVAANVLAIAWGARRQTLSLRSWAPLACFLLSFAVLGAYKQYAYNPHYRQEMVARVVWHNALMGFSSNPALAERYKIRISDASAADAVISYMRERHDRRLTSAWTAQNVLNAFGGHGTFDWKAYESAGRELYFSVWREHPGEALHCYLIDKPREMAGIVATAASFGGGEYRDVLGIYFRPFGVSPLLIALPGFLLLAVGRARRPPLVSIAAGVALAGVLPGLLIYAVPLTMVSAFLGLALLAYGLVVEAGSAIAEKR